MLPAHTFFWEVAKMENRNPELVPKSHLPIVAKKELPDFFFFNISMKMRNCESLKE